MKEFDRAACSGLGLIVSGIVIIVLNTLSGSNVTFNVSRGFLYTYSAAFTVAGFFIGAFLEKKTKVRELFDRISDLRKIEDYYQPRDQILLLVEERLTDVATQWHRTLRELRKEQLYNADNMSRSDFISSREREEELEAQLERCQETFENLYDHAERVFGTSSVVRERDIELFVKKDVAA